MAILGPDGQPLGAETAQHAAMMRDMAGAPGRVVRVAEAHAAAVEVHVLHGGVALCGRMRGVPADWPAGHLWARVENREAATCRRCKSLADELAASMGQPQR